MMRVLLSLSDAATRVSWLQAELARLDAPTAARLLDELCEENERSVPEAREAMVSVALLLVSCGECELLEELRQQALKLRLCRLERIVRRVPGPPPAEEGEVDELPVPDYGTGRELTVGERRSLARRPSRAAFARLLNDPHPLVIRQLLGNPHLTEDDVIRLVTRRPARTTELRVLAESPRWLSRPRVRLAIVLNPGTPGTISLPLLSLCTRAELEQVVQQATVPLVLRAIAHELLERRPPLESIGQRKNPIQ